MDLTTFARGTAPAIVDIPSNFMIDGATYVRGGELGFEGMDFYVAGRGGPLGDVHGDVVAAAFFFFNPNMIREAWDRSEKVTPRLQAGREFAGCAHRWAEAHLPDSVDYSSVNTLLDKVSQSASPAGAPLFAAWRAFQEPESPKALAIHRLNVLRELRGAYHEAAVLAAGMSPPEAVAVHHPFMLAIYGWPAAEDGAALPEVSWKSAEEATDRLFGRVFSVLGDAERSQLGELLAALVTG